MWITKKKLRQELAHTKEQLQHAENTCKELSSILVELQDAFEDMNKKYPFKLGQVVYDVQLRSSKGRFTKTKASREHSLINEVVVDKRNYFNLVDRYTSKDVFIDKLEAEKYLEVVCIE